MFEVSRAEVQSLNQQRPGVGGVGADARLPVGRLLLQEGEAAGLSEEQLELIMKVISIQSMLDGHCPIDLI